MTFAFRLATARAAERRERQTLVAGLARKLEQFRALPTRPSS